MSIGPTTGSLEGGARPATGEAAEQRSRLAGHRATVAALTVAAAAGYSVFALAQYRTFRTSSYDLVIFDQAVRSYAHFKPGVSIIKGLHNGFGTNFSVLGDHWSPLLAVLAPLYWIYDSPLTLLLAQAALFALAIPPLWLFTRRAFGGIAGVVPPAGHTGGGRTATAAAYLVSVAYAVSWPIASALAFDFHEVAFAPLLTAVALERLQAGRLRPALIALAALLLVKEDMGLLIAGFGIYLAVARPRTVRRQLPVGLALIAAGLVATVVTTYWLIPAFGGRSDYYWAYTALGKNVPQALGHLIIHPVAALRLLITPRVKLDTMLWLFGAFCFLPLRSPLALAAVPLLLERMLASIFPDWWGTSDQYNAFLVVILACAAVDGAARLDRALQARRYRGAGPEQAGPDQAAAQEPAPNEPAEPSAREDHAGEEAAGQEAAAGRPGPAVVTRRHWPVAVVTAGAMCAVGLILVPKFGFGPALHPSFYQQDAQAQAAAAADAVVPSGVVVETVNDLGPQLSARDTVLLWDGDGDTPPLGAPWVVANVSQPQFTFPTVQAQVQRVALLEHHGYRVVFRRDGYVVLHRPGPPAGISAARPSPVSAAGADSKEAAG